MDKLELAKSILDDVTNIQQNNALLYQINRDLTTLVRTNCEAIKDLQNTVDLILTDHAQTIPMMVDEPCDTTDMDKAISQLKICGLSSQTMLIWPLTEAPIAIKEFAVDNYLEASSFVILIPPPVKPSFMDPNPFGSGKLFELRSGHKLFFSIRSSNETA